MKRFQDFNGIHRPSLDLRLRKVADDVVSACVCSVNAWFALHSHMILHARSSTRRQISLSSAPATLLITQLQLQNPTLQEEAMPNPIPRIHLSIQPRPLHINPLILGIEIPIPYRRDFPREWGSIAHILEKGRRDEVDVLACDGEEAGHGEGDEAAGGAGVVVAWQAGLTAVEGGGDVGVDS